MQVVMQGLNGDVEVLTINSKRTGTGSFNQKLQRMGAMHRYIQQETGDDGMTGRQTVLCTLTNGDNR